MFNRLLLRKNEYIENNTWVRGNTRLISSVEHDIMRNVQHEK